MSDVFAWTTFLLPLLIAALLAIHLVLARRREVELGWKIAEQKSAQIEATEQSILSAHAAELARSLHDDLGHRLTLAAIESAALQVRANSTLSPDIARLHESIAQCVEALNRSVSELTQDVGRFNLRSAIEIIAADLRRASTSVRVSVELSAEVGAPAHLQRADPADEDNIPATVSAAILSVVREGCTNALRHAPGSSIDVHVSDDDGDLVVEVENDLAMDSETSDLGLRGSQLGLSGLRVQLETLGGRLNAGPSSAGWRIRARCPRRPNFDLDQERNALVRQQHRTRRLLIAVPVAVAVLMLAIPVAAVLGQAALSSLPTNEFEAIRVGQDEESVRQELPLVEMESPPPQERAGDCVHHESTFSPFERTDVYEVCFSDGTVRSTTVIAAP